MNKEQFMVANAAGDITPMDNGNIEPGVICAANAARFTEAHFSEPLTTYAVGWRDQDGLQETLDFVAPPTMVPRKFEYNEWTNSEMFNYDADDIRAVGADFKRVELTKTKTTKKTLNKGLVYRVDLDNVDENTNWRETFVATLTTRLLRSELKRAIALLVANATNTNKTWDTTAGKDPDQDMLSEVVTSTGVIGIPPTNLLVDLTAWGLRAKAHRAQNTAGGFSSAGLSVQQAAEGVGLVRGRIVRHKYVSAGTTKSSVAGGNYVLIYLANPNTSIEDPSNIKRFVTQTMGGTMVRVYEQQMTLKTVDITVEHYSLPAVCSTLGIRMLTIS